MCDHLLPPTCPRPECRRQERRTGAGERGVRPGPGDSQHLRCIPAVARLHLASRNCQTQVQNPSPKSPQFRVEIRLGLVL